MLPDEFFYHYLLIPLFCELYHNFCDRVLVKDRSIFWWYTFTFNINHTLVLLYIMLTFRLGNNIKLPSYSLVLEIILSRKFHNKRENNL